MLEHTVNIIIESGSINPNLNAMSLVSTFPFRKEVRIAIRMHSSTRYIKCR
jgi:hypothetical protein